LAVFTLGIYLLYRYMHHFSRNVADLGQLLAHIEQINSGQAPVLPPLAAAADLADAVANLNALQAGISQAVAEKLKAERLKVDLVTNVSHDLKTPLTSIVSYIELLE